MFEGYSIDSITNGVHAATWVSPPFQGLYDEYIPGWKEDNLAFHMPSICRNRKSSKPIKRQKMR